MNVAVIVEERPGTGTFLMNGKLFWVTGDGGHLPDGKVKAQDKLQDETVRKVFGFARALSARISRFRAHTMADLTSLDQLLEQQYGFVKTGNKGKGNRTYMTVDQLLKVTVQVADHIAFGPELQVARQLVDECITDWSQDARDEIQALISGAFDTDKDGQISRTRICSLLRLAIDDPRWLQAMDAIRDAQRVVGRKEYVRFQMRETFESGWVSLTIDMAQA